MMSEYTLEDIYQCTLDEFAEKMGTSIDALIARKWKKIDILQAAYVSVVEGRGDLSKAMLAKAISEKIHKERRSIERYERWLKESTRATRSSAREPT